MEIADGHLISFGYNILGYNNVGPGPLGPANFSNVPQSQKWPEVQQYSFGIQRLPDNAILTASYVGSLGRHLQHSRNINQVPINSGIENYRCLPAPPVATPRVTAMCRIFSSTRYSRPCPLFRIAVIVIILQWESTGNSNYNSLQINLRHNVDQDLILQAAYTWSHTLDDIVSNQVDDSNMHRWYGTSSLKLYVYSPSTTSTACLPDSKSRWLRATASGWEISGISSFMTGPPIDTTCGIAGMATGIGGPAVCNSNGSLTVQKGTVQDPQFGATQTWFDPGALAQGTVDHYGPIISPACSATWARIPLPVLDVTIGIWR